ncbi:excisionase family DNA-binding protein [Amycolatopsis aidingensis]|uniref:excisionase family DNA-binding protein n=1 Tax=Amycolatopsis aidingensis TaxID=2842453 RepID=UPI001C0B8852|nr:excisionase family DNA-binding protein [Amycolatopsis aidingensis]
MSAATKQETYLPGEDEAQVVQVHDFLKAHEDMGRGRPESRYFLSGGTPNDRVELPAELYRVLRQVAEALQAGLAVSIAPVTKTLTTQQAADLLGVSRPTVIRLLDEKEIPFEKVGNRRRILLRDLLDYRKKRRAAQYAALEATAVDDDEDIDSALNRLRIARRGVAKRRRGNSME